LNAYGREAGTETIDSLLGGLREFLLEKDPGSRVITRLDELRKSLRREEENRLLPDPGKWGPKIVKVENSIKERFSVYEHVQLWSASIQWTETYWPPEQRHRILKTLGDTILRSMGAAAEGLQNALAHIAEQHESSTWLAQHDHLTGLLNRAGLSEYLEEAMERALRNERLLALCLIDLNDFKPINDQYGHQAGDKVLQEIARRMEEHIRKIDAAARLGGDEFVVVLEALPSASHLEQAMERLIRALDHPISIPEVGMSRSVTPSIGVVIYPLSGTNEAETLLRQADRAMYSIKERKNHPDRKRWHLYDCTRDDLYDKKREASLLFKYGEIIPYYQPIVRLSDGEVTGVEALARIVDAEGKLHGPAEFTTVMSKSEDRFLTAFMLDQAVSHLERMQKEQGIRIHASINMRPDLAATQFCQDIVIAAIEGRDVDASRITIEIVETEQFSNRLTAYTALSQLRALGVRVAIDDIGTGHASLARLKEMPVDEIKLDQTFVRELLEKPSGLAFVSAMRDLAQDMGVDFVAEGVEHLEILDALALIGIPHGQGFAIARPMPYEELREWLVSWEEEKNRRFPPGTTNFGLYAYHNSITKGVKRLLSQANPIINPNTIGDVNACPVCTSNLGNPEITRLHQRLHEELGKVAKALLEGKTPDWDALSSTEEAFADHLLGHRPFNMIANAVNG